MTSYIIVKEGRETSTSLSLSVFKFLNSTGATIKLIFCLSYLALYILSSMLMSMCISAFCMQTSWHVHTLHRWQADRSLCGSFLGWNFFGLKITLTFIHCLNHACTCILQHMFTYECFACMYWLYPVVVSLSHVCLLYGVACPLVYRVN